MLLSLQLLWNSIFSLLNLKRKHGSSPNIVCTVCSVAQDIAMIMFGWLCQFIAFSFAVLSDTDEDPFQYLPKHNKLRLNVSAGEYTKAKYADDFNISRLFCTRKRAEKNIVHQHHQPKWDSRTFVFLFRWQKETVCKLHIITKYPILARRLLAFNVSVCVCVFLHFCRYFFS